MWAAGELPFPHGLGLEGTPGSYCNNPHLTDDKPRAPQRGAQWLAWGLTWEKQPCLLTPSHKPCSHLPRPEGPAHRVASRPHSSALSLLGAGYRRSRQLTGSRELLDSWVLHFLYFLGEATELEGLEEATQYGRAEMRAREAQPLQI